MPTRFTHTIDDINDPDRLLAFALAAQLARLEQVGISQNTVAKRSSIGEANLAKALSGRLTLTEEKLERLDNTIVSLGWKKLDRTGGLSQLAVRLRGLRNRTGLTVKKPANHAEKYLERDPRHDDDVIDQANILVSLFLPREGGSTAEINDLRAMTQDKIALLVDHLILIGIAPPTALNVEALTLLGNLSRFSPGSMRHQIEEALRSMPLGFRIWRALTKLVLLTAEPGRAAPPHQRQVRSWIRELLRGADELREISAYPARSLDLELAIAVPKEWCTGDEDWPGDFLRRRITNRDATLREYGTATHGLWQRALTHRTEQNPEPEAVKAAERDLRAVIRGYRDSSGAQDAAGLRWVATTLEYLIDTRTAVINTWPEVDEPWYAAVRNAEAYLDHREIPEHLLPAAKALFLHALLQNAGTQRRRAIDTLRAGGLTEPFMGALGQVLQEEKEEAWLRARALFALGFLQQRDATVAAIFTNAYKEAHVHLTGPNPPTASRLDEMHAVLFAIGDCFGPTPTAAPTRNLRASIARQLRDLVAHEHFALPEFRQVRLALCYMLIFTAQPRRAEDPVDAAEELLRGLSEDPDEICARFSDWALGFRFGEDGSVRPLFEARDVMFT